MIQRENQILAVLRYLKHKPVTAIVGGRQVGKSTLALEIAARFEGPSKLYKLDTVRDRQLMRIPERELAGAEGLIILDEVQRHPRLFPTLPKILELNGDRARFLLLGGTPANLQQLGLEHLSDSIVVHELPGLSLHEVGADKFRQLWLRGGLPRSFTARSKAASFEWRTQHTLDIIESDPQRSGPPISAGTMRSFLLSLAQYHGKVLDMVELARSFGMRNSSVQRYLDILQESSVIRLINPYQSGQRAAEVISPKLFFSDTGVLHNLLGYVTMEELEASPKAPLSWKGFAMESTIQRIRAGASECFHWTIKTGQGIDLMIMRRGFRWGFEFQYGDRARITPSMKISMRELKLDRLDVIHHKDGPGKLGGKVQVHTLESLPHSMRLPEGFERRPEFIEMEKELAGAGV